MQKTLIRLTEWLTIVTFFVPLVVVPSGFIFPFIVPKALAFRILAVCITTLYLLIAFQAKKYRPKFSLITLGVALFFLSFAISTFTGVDWYRSLWDNHERMLGLFTVLHYGGCYLALTHIFQAKEKWMTFSRWFLAGGAAVMAIGVFQKINPDLLLNNGAARVASTLGNAIYVSGYGLFLLFLGLWLSFEEKTRVWKRYARVMAAVGFVGIFLGGTRGTVLGLLAGSFVGAITYIFTAGKANKTHKHIALAVLLGVVVLGSSLFAFRQTDFVRSIPVVKRFATISFETIGENPRVMAWGIAYDSWKERPVFGWGPSNFYHAFNEYYAAEFLRHSWSETWFDNAHNIVMNTLSTQGLFGIATYMYLFIAVFIMVMNAYKEEKISAQSTMLFLAFLAGHFVHNIFVFENITSYLYFFFFLALVNSYTRELHQETGEEKTISQAGLIGAAAIAAIFILVTNIHPARANQQALGAIRSAATGGSPITAYQTVTAPTPHIDDVRADLVRNTQPLIRSYLAAGQQENAIALVNFYQELLAENRTLHPLDIRTHIHQAEVAMEIAGLSGDGSALAFAENTIRDALVISPERQQLHFLLASVSLQQGREQETIKILKETVALDPMVQDSWWRLALLQAQMRDYDAAYASIAEAEALGVRYRSDGKEALKEIDRLAKKNGYTPPASSQPSQ